MKTNLNHLSNKHFSKGVEILSIGSELLLGNILNTNSRWIAEQLSCLGVGHYRQLTIGDNLERISTIIKEISLRANLLITTGGLGPTPDDLTTEAICSAFNAKLYERNKLWEEIKKKISTPISNIENSSLKKQCLFPENAKIINNPRGIAPGMIWEPIEGFTIMTFPGVPSELKSMWNESAFDYIKANFSDGSVFFSKTLKFSGIGESILSEQIYDLLELKNPTVAPYASLGEVKLRITAKAESEFKAKGMIKPIKEQLKTKFSRFIFGEDDETLPSIVIKQLLERNESLAFAESCTGGLLSASITSIPGSSVVFKGGLVTYSNLLKESLLNVPNDQLARYGAVSQEVAKSMSVGVKNNLKADWAISVSGIAGPGGGSPQKPIGLVYISILGPNNQSKLIKKSYNPRFNREEIQTLSVNEALNSLRLILLSIKE